LIPASHFGPVRARRTINGDVYCTGDLTNNGMIGGDVFATGTITGANIEGREETVAQAPVAWPNLAVADFEPPTLSQRIT